MKRYEKNEEYDLWLACLGGESSVKTVQIAKEAGGSEALFSLPRDGLLKLKGVGERSADYIIEGRKSWDAEKKRAELAQKGIRFIPWYDRDYPKRLLQTEGYPFALFVKGELPPEERSSVAIIGARECSEYGREAASFFAKALASADVSVISGMAIGIDGISQMEALRAGGRSFGVLGCGVDVCYPASNRNLYRMLEEHGGLISEYAPGVSAITWHFPARNRIISGLCDLLLVVEAKEQ
ncbi:MAG: DNA-protecting protein DprA, partial [Lachnospiraceae bacterium]|nr:DNA-protecting protein DprA [Lachnospiraceae bacterium]